jgi:butyrate response factor 1
MSKLKYSKKFIKESNPDNIQEELVKNKFDYNYNTKSKKTYSKKYNNNHWASRKYSKDSSNLSTSNEDIQESTDSNHITINQNSTNPSNFKGKASDFKIKYKTELCKFYELTGQCKYGDNCAYAHGKENLRAKVTNTTAYRTKKCIQFFENGYCPYGNRCQFQHQLKNNIVNNPYDTDMSYKKILEIISKFENVRNVKKLVEKPRLSIFREITGDFQEDEIKSRLLDDIKQLDDFSD